MNILRVAAPCVVAGLLAFASSAPAQQSGGADPTAPLTSALAAELAQKVNRPVIVIMRRQLTGAAAANDQAPVISELARVHATNIKRYRLVSAFAATVSGGELARLRANPAIAQIVPDAMIHRPRRAGAGAPSAKNATPNANASVIPNVISGACGATTPLLEPEALQVTNTASDDPTAKTARSLRITGAGVKVAWIADGVDPNNINFIRPNNTSAFVDYQDFSGDGPGRQTGGGEAFLDANAIAGQGFHIYDVSTFSAQPDPTACNIRIEGVAPGAALVGLDVFGTFENTTTSNILQAIDYAVFTDHVDVLNESFGSNPFPDETALDATKLFNDAAVQAGVTVTVSSGDAGATNTIGSPASDPNVIAVGASTTFRFYAQTNFAAARYFATAGWLNDNISSLSSSGFDETGRTVDLVAPGDLAFASCDALPVFSECANFQGQASDVESSGGTSLSAPLTAGAAALVIQAYRKFHNGASPTPALVKQILTSTASDLGVPATEQGAGLLNSYKAVLLAESIKDGNGSPVARGRSLLLSTNQLNAIGRPGGTHAWPVTVTNTGAAGQAVRVSGRTFGPVENVRAGSVVLNDGRGPQFTDWRGLQNNFAIITFNIPAGADRLNASIAYPGNPANGFNSVVRLILIDPQGRFAAHSLPQGVGNFGNVDVREPVPGTWTGVIFSDVASAGGTNGTVHWKISTQSFVPFGKVTPSSLFLAAGESQSIEVTASTPATPGDAAGSIVLTSSGGGIDGTLGTERNSIAVTLRSLIDIKHGGAFRGVLTGDNGRSPGEGQVDYYQFAVGSGTTSIMANLSLTKDAGDNVGTYLIGPDGNALGFGQNNLGGTNGLSQTAYTLNPVPGTWTLIVDSASPVVGDKISQPFTGNISLNQVKVSAPGLPNNAHTILPAGVPVAVPVTITNTGPAPEDFFVDARLNTAISLPLALLDPPNNSNQFTLPLTGNAPLWLVPTQSSSVQAAATATLPIEFDYGSIAGDPDLLGAPTTTDGAAGSYTPSGGTVTPGLWFGAPDELGPYAGPAPAGSVKMSLTATTKPFDPAVTSPTGDFWLFAINPATAFSAVTINPGQTGVITVTITPSGTPGTAVSGTLYVDDFLSGVPPYGQQAGDELAAIPYSDTVGPAVPDARPAATGPSLR